MLLKLEIIDFSGHCADDIALYDKKNKTIYSLDKTEIDDVYRLNWHYTHFKRFGL